MSESRTRTYPTSEAFVAAVVEAGIRRVVLRRVAENRPIEGPTSVAYRGYRRIDLIAYADSVLHKCVLEDARPADVAGPLSQGGLEVKVVDGNIF